MYIEKVSNEALKEYISKNKSMLMECNPTDIIEVDVSDELGKYKKLQKDMITKSAYVKVFDENKKLKQTTRLKFNDYHILAQFSYSKEEFAPINLSQDEEQKYRQFIKTVASKTNEANHEDEQLSFDF